MNAVGRFSLFVCAIVAAQGQSIIVVPAPEVRMPAPVFDGNSPGVWVDGNLRVYTSTGDPEGQIGPDITRLSVTDAPAILPRDHYPIWIESVWKDEDGTIYGWYHHEPGGVCGGKLTAPKIGALVSTDGGVSFRDLGIVLESGDAPNCSAENGFFAGGHGDFSVILDREKKFFYFLFTNYGGQSSSQGVAMARMAFEARFEPVGAVYKFADGGWNSPGVGGAVTPILPARVSWADSNTDSYWGPAIHWNTAIEQYVVLLNRSCCKSGWPQEGIYAMFGTDLSDPKTWTSPVKFMDASQIGFAPGYYPQVFGLGEGETDSVAGQGPRLFIKGVSNWQMWLSPTSPEEVTPNPGEDRDEAIRRPIGK